MSVGICNPPDFAILGPFHFQGGAYIYEQKINFHQRRCKLHHLVHGDQRAVPHLGHCAWLIGYA